MSLKWRAAKLHSIEKAVDHLLEVGRSKTQEETITTSQSAGKHNSLENVLQVDEYVATISPGNEMKKVTLKEGTMQEEVFFDGLEGGKIEYTITGLAIITGEL